MTLESFTLPSPGKLNLFLHITGRRPDGYHELQTVFQFFDYGDELSFSLRQDGEINITPEIEGVKAEDNLVYKAARKLQVHTGCDKGVDIQLMKRLPMGGGVGGGSSNAATTLHGLNLLWGLNLSKQTLAELGLTLGADVPIFVHGEAAFAEGIGEKFTPVFPDEPWYLIVKPDCHISTMDIFGHPQLPRNTPKVSARHWQSTQTHNDCEEIACERFPQVAKARQWLLEYAPVKMTGTGACLFAEFSSKEAAQDLLAHCPDIKWNVFVAEGRNVSPLIEAVKQLNHV